MFWGNHLNLLSISSTCISSVPLTLKGSQCKLIQETVMNTLIGDPPTYVASFGNSDVNSVGDWVKILNTRPVNEVGCHYECPNCQQLYFSCLAFILWCFFVLQAVQGEGECQNMRLGLHIEILFAYFGFLAKPQPKVRAFQFTV